MRRPFNRLLFFILISFFAACAPKYSQYITRYETTTANRQADYSNLYYWAAHPGKKDPSDSVPQPLQQQYAPDSSADVFFLYPTTFTDYNSANWNAAIDDAALNAKTDYSPILYQASVFNEYRVFSPRYRQANIRAYFTTDTASAKAAFHTDYTDIQRSFKYYLDH